jgi:ubiquinone/menaquinone biosynthesis C-methylase UbiE
LAESGPHPLILLTDPSPKFLRITQQKVEQAGIARPSVRYAVMMAEDLHKVPAGSLSLVAMRSTLHHVSDVEKMIADAARSLRPGGALVVQEPCWEGYVLMGAMAQFMPAVLGQAGVKMTEGQQKQVQLFVDTMQFYARRDMDKSQAEDKHLFKIDELMRWSLAGGLAGEFVANRTFEEIEPTGPAAVSHHSFTGFFGEYLKYCMSFEQPLVDLFKKHMTPYCKYIEDLSANNNGPYMHGLFLARRV